MTELNCIQKVKLVSKTYLIVAYYLSLRAAGSKISQNMVYTNLGLYFSNLDLRKRTHLIYVDIRIYFFFFF